MQKDEIITLLTLVFMGLGVVTFLTGFRERDN